MLGCLQEQKGIVLHLYFKKIKLNWIYNIHRRIPQLHAGDWIHYEHELMQVHCVTQIIKIDNKNTEFPYLLADGYTFVRCRHLSHIEGPASGVTKPHHSSRIIFRATWPKFELIDGETEIYRQSLKKKRKISSNEEALDDAEIEELCDNYFDPWQQDTATISKRKRRTRTG